MSLHKVVLLALVYFPACGLCISGTQSQKDIAQAIRELGDDAFTVREKASQFLWSAGSAAEPALQAALKSDDPEVVARSRSVLERFKYGIYPETPPHIVALVKQFRSGHPDTRQATVDKLLALDGEGFLVVLKLAAAEEDAVFRGDLLLQLVREAPRITGALLVEGKLDAAQDLLKKTVLHRKSELS